MTNNIITISTDELRHIIHEEVTSALMEQESAKGTMNSKQVMQYLKCSRTTLLRHKKSGALVPVSDDGKNCLYRAIDVRKFAGVED